MIGTRMKDLRLYYDNTQQEIANALCVSRSTYAGWENSIDSIPLLRLNDFCNFYEISLDYICGISNEKKKKNFKNIDLKLLGKNLKEIRIINNDTQKTIANQIKVEQSNYSKYELGKVMIQTYLFG